MLGNFLKIDHTVVCLLKLVNFACLFIWNDRLSGKQVGSQASRLAWIQPVCISINAVPALKGLIKFMFRWLYPHYSRDWWVSRSNYFSKRKYNKLKETKQKWKKHCKKQFESGGLGMSIVWVTENKLTFFVRMTGLDLNYMRHLWLAIQ